MAKKKGSPRVAREPQPSKRPTTGAFDPGASQRELITWRFSYVDLDGPWGWRGLLPHLEEVLKKLIDIEKLTVGELVGRPGNKPIDVASICPEAQRRLQEIERDDLDVMWELRLSGKKRVWGVLTEAVFHLLWWDPEHTVCPSEKKHT